MSIISKPCNDAYREGWDKVFGEEQEHEHEEPEPMIKEADYHCCASCQEC